MIFCALALFAGITFYSCKPSDEKLQKEVTTALSATPAISSSVKGGVVTLTGIVESEEAKAAAESVVKSVKDIKSVVNNIEIKAPEPVINPDDTLTTTINEALASKGYKDITVSVKDGEVTLTGTAKKADLQKIMQIANESKPKKVINQIKIK